jgi:hypothetical protein
MNEETVYKPGMNQQRSECEASVKSRLAQRQVQTSLTTQHPLTFAHIHHRDAPPMQGHHFFHQAQTQATAFTRAAWAGQ